MFVGEATEEPFTCTGGADTGRAEPTMPMALLYLVEWVTNAAHQSPGQQYHSSHVPGHCLGNWDVLIFKKVSQRAMYQGVSVLIHMMYVQSVLS